MSWFYRRILITFTHLLNSYNELFGIYVTEYANKHFLKKFVKDYKGKQWEYTEESIKQDLSRLGLTNNTTQKSSQIDELMYKDNNWLAKYDFRIAGSKLSSKESGNRCIIYINGNKMTIDILLIYNKNDLPKNKQETKYIYDVIKTEYPDIKKIFEIK